MEKQRVEEIAANRLKLISPLLDTALDRDKKQMLKEQICIQSGLSERTIRRYLNLYQEKGFEGLKPQSSGRGGNSIIPEEVMQEAIALRREVPKRSINEIIRILEWEGKVEPGTLKRSTLQDQLSYRGYSSRQMRTYASSVTSARRFQKPWRNYLWQSDIKYGIYVNGQPTYMVCFLDDCTRNVMHSEFYSTLDQKIVQDCFRKALLKYGAPDSVFFDNGVQFRTHCDGFPSCRAKPLVITGHAAPKPELPEHYEKKEPQTSRLLDAADRKNKDRQEIRKTAISFTGMEGGVR